MVMAFAYPGHSPSSDNTISRIIKLVEDAQESKAPTERFIEKFSRYYTPLVLLFRIFGCRYSTSHPGRIMERMDL